MSYGNFGKYVCDYAVEWVIPALYVLGAFFTLLSLDRFLAYCLQSPGVVLPEEFEALLIAGLLTFSAAKVLGALWSYG